MHWRRRTSESGCGALEAVLEQNVFHRGDPRLTTAVEGARQRPIGERWGWDRKTPTVDITLLVAASLALWGLRTLKPTGDRPLSDYVLLPSAEPQQLVRTGSKVRFPRAR